MSFFPFLGGSFEGRSAAFDAQRTINMYFEQSESQLSKSPGMLLGTPGLLLWTNLAGGRVRGCIRFSATVSIWVIGTNVWKVESDKTATSIGTVPDAGLTVCMASNGKAIMMVDGQQGWIIDPTGNTITVIGDAGFPSFPGPTRCDFCDGYFIYNFPNTGQFGISGLYTTTFAALDFATAEGAPDNIISIIVDHREIWLLGEDSTEVWYNVGDVDFPFQRIQGAYLEVGCIAAQSVAKIDNSIFWLATDDRGFGTVQRANGYTPQRVSNHAVETAVEEYQKAGGNIMDAIAYTYAQGGHLFYMLTFPQADYTWCYDVSTNLWHERAQRYDDGELGRHRSNCHINFAGMALVGDYANGNIYSLDLDTFTDNGAILPAIRICPHISSDEVNVQHKSLQLTIQGGQGLATGQGFDPQIMLQWSDDGGYAWSSERWVSAGKIGERRARARWTRLGQARDRVYKVTMTDPVKRVFTGCSLVTAPCKT